MKSFTSDETAAVSNALKSHGVGQHIVRPFPSIECPVCHEGRILRYRYLRPRGTTGDALFGYVWCSHCMRYVGLMGPTPEWWVPEDALTQAEHEQFERDDVKGLEQMLKRVGALEQAIG